MVDVLLGENILIHAVDSIANHFPGGVGRNLELYSILLIVEESVRAFQLFNEITPQRQFFGRLHHTILIGIEHIGFDSGITAVGVDHGQAFPASIIIKLIDGKCSIGQLDSLASLGVHLDQLQVAFHLLIQDVVGHIAVAGLCYTTIRLTEDTLGRVAVHLKAKGIGLEHIFRDGGLNDEILAIGQTGHTNDAFLIRVNFAQTIFVGRASRYPAETAAVGEIACIGQSRVISVHQIGVALEHPGDRLGFASEIIFQSVGVVVVLAVGIQHTLDIVAAVRVAGELVRLAQIGDAVDGKTSAFQLGSGAARASGTYQFTEFKTALQDCIQALFAFPDYIAGFVAIGQGFIVVDLIAEVTFGVAQIVAVVGLKAFRRTSFSNGGVLVFINVVGVFAIILLQRRVLTSRLQFAVQFRILTGDVELAVGIHGQHKAGSPLYQIVFAQVQISEHQHPILDLGARHQMIFGKDGQVGIIPAAVGAHCGMPDGIAILIGDLAVVNHTTHTIGMENILSGIKVVHGPFNACFAMRRSSGHFPVLTIFGHRCGAQLIQIGFCQDDLAQNSIILEHIVLGNHGIAILVVCEAGAVGHISSTGILRLTINGYGCFSSIEGQLCAAGIAGGNVSIVVGVIQPDHAAVIVLGNLNIVSTLTKRSAGLTRMFNVCPIAEVAVRRFGLDDDKTALVALGVVHGPGGIELGAIIGTVGDGISSILVADHMVSVIGGCCCFARLFSVERDIHLRNNIPFEDLILRIRSDRFAGFAVRFPDIDLQRPFIVSHEVFIRTVHGDRDGLLASMFTIVELKSYRDDRLIETEINADQLAFGRSNGPIHHALSFGAQLCFSTGFGTGCCRIGFGLTGIRALTAAQAAGGGLGHTVVQAPAGAGVASVILVIVIHSVATGGHGLFIRRSDAPIATVNRTTLFQGFNLNGGTVHFFAGFKLLLVHVDCVVRIKTAAGSLGRSRPTGVILGTCGRNVRINAAGGRSDQCNSLPTGNRGLVDVGIIVTFRHISGYTVAHLLEGTDITLSRNAVRIVGNNPTLYLIIDGIHSSIGTHQTERQLPQTTPNIYLVAKMIAGRVLGRRYDGSVRIIVGRTSVRTALRTVGAAVCFLPVKPNQP